MLPRILTVIVVFFWLGSMGWLCAVVWAPPESRMAQIDPREVYRVFFGWNDSTSMTLLENGIRKGQITIAGGSGENLISGKFSNSLSMSGTIEKYEPAYEATTVDLFWKGQVDFYDTIELQEAEFSIRVPRRMMTAQLALSGDPLAVSARATIAGKEVLKFGGETESGPSLPLSMLPIGAMLNEYSIDPNGLKWENEARMGSFSFGGRDMRAYLLILRAVEQGLTLRVYLSEVGEPLRIETDLGFEAVSEILVPLEAYRNQAGSDKG